MTPKQFEAAIQALNAAKVPSPQGLLVPDLYSKEITNYFKDSVKWIRDVLDPNNVWAPTGENYEEPAAWAKLLGVRVYTSHELNGPTFFLNKPGFPTKTLSVCSPSDLVTHIRDYAQNAKAPQVDDE